MLIFHSCQPGHDSIHVDLAATSSPPAAIWIDMLNPSKEEIGFVERVAGVHVPDRDQLSEIETSSRLRMTKEAIYMSAPVMFKPEGEAPRLTPVGLILTPDRFVTIRFEEIASFKDFRAACEAEEGLSRDSAAAMLGLLGSIVDRGADALEAVSTDLDGISHQIFDGAGSRKVSQNRAEKSFRLVLRRVGQIGDFASHIRSTLLGLGRAAAYAADNAAWLGKDAKHHFEALRLDITSLGEFEARLSEKVQFLLDATLGFISMDQNDTFKVLTVASVIGIPPTLIASMYGMNFKNMPELNWEWGYPYGLTLILLSAIIPAVWLKVRGWF